MSWIVQILWYVFYAIGLAMLSVVLNILLIALRWCSLKYINHVWRVYQALKPAADDLMLRCNGQSVAVVRHEPGGEETLVPFYTGVLTWKSGNKLAKRVRMVARRQMIYRCAAWLLFFPVAIGCVIYMSWHAYVVSTSPSPLTDGHVLIPLITIIPMLIFHQFSPFTIFMWPGLMALFDEVD